MRPIEKSIPNLLTFGNLFCGFLAILACVSEDLVLAAWLVFMAAIFDLLDGLAAKLLKAGSAIGSQLDSLADVVSFGIVPGLIVYILLLKTHSPWLDLGFISNISLMAFIPFLIPAAGAYRLARYNANTGEESIGNTSIETFTGLPIPSAAMIFASLPLMLYYDNVFLVSSDIYKVSAIILSNQPYLLLILTGLISWLMVSNIPFFSLKIKDFKSRESRFIILFFIISIVLFALLLWVSAPFIMLLYLIFSLIIKKNTHEIQSTH